MPGIRVNEVENGGHKRERNYELKSENGGWEEDESQLKTGGLHYRCGKDSKKVPPDVEDLHPACVRALRKNEEVINDILHPYSIIFDPSTPGKEFLPCRTAFLACSLDREY